MIFFYNKFLTISTESFPPPHTHTLTASTRAATTLLTSHAVDGEGEGPLPQHGGHELGGVQRAVEALLLVLGGVLVVLDAAPLVDHQVHLGAAQSRGWLID